MDVWYIEPRGRKGKERRTTEAKRESGEAKAGAGAKVQGRPKHISFGIL